MDLPLCVDLDGTLIKSDSLFESLILLIKKNPLFIFPCLFWLFTGGKVYFKQQIAARIQLNPTLLPYTQSFLTYLQQEKAKGRYLALVTASHRDVATPIADHLGLFSEVIATDNSVNIKGKNKRDILNNKFGSKQYDYAGNSKDDLDVWVAARAAILVNATTSIVKQCKKLVNIEKIFNEKEHSLKAIIKSFRIHQYVKNFLVFVPLFTGHLFFDATAVLQSMLAFVIFCLLASSAYLLNDLLDLESDRQHRTKHKRAFAAGDIALSFGLLCVPLLFIIAGVFSLFLPKLFCLSALTYYLLTVLYSFYFKNIVLFDVFVLAILYTIRIIAGITAINSEYSPWLIAFSIFIFLSLAFVKRCGELQLIDKGINKLNPGRGYVASDLMQLQIFGTVSGYISVLVFALYINSEKVVALYRSSMSLWIICLILLYWISRVWMLAVRGSLHDDPIVFALKDKVSWAAILISILIVILSAK